MPALTEYYPEEILRELNSHLKLSPPLPSFRGRQIFSWLARGAGEFAAMTDLPADLRETLENRETLFSSRVDTILRDPDGTQKLKIRLSDGLFIESVLLADQAGRLTACVSSQGGCAMGCLFCRTGELGLIRNLSPGEIAEQFYFLSRLEGLPGSRLPGGSRISNLVFMGMGEPLDNYDALMKAAGLLSHPGGVNLSPGKMTVSTCGLVPGIKKLGDSPLPVRLAVSLNSPRQEVRERLMPIAKTYPLEELRDSLGEYQQKKGKRITLEYVLLKGINDQPEDILALCRFIGPLKAAVNLIPWNPVADSPFKSPGPGKIRDFAAALEEKGITVTQRFGRGREINGACGQLAGTPGP